VSLGEVIRQSIQVTAFVAVMLVAVDYVNVLTRGTWQRALRTRRGWQCVIAAALGATPGCLGAFVVVALFTHGMVSLGALVACMVATSGDEAFVMLALFPAKAALLGLGLAGAGIATGLITDAVTAPSGTSLECERIALHEKDDACQCFPRGRVLEQLRSPGVARLVLASAGLLFLLAIIRGWMGPDEWNWLRGTLLGLTGFVLFVVGTVPDHFLEEHLWSHVARQHVPRIFLWTLGALLVTGLMAGGLDMASIVRDNPWLVLVVACLVGIIPESGPHLIFVTLYSQGTVPLGPLAASSIVQDGHGMLPLLAHSRRDFVMVKTINLAVGLLVGGVLTALRM
jgi:hypothetical protein